MSSDGERRPGVLVILSGPSGVGKTTVAQQVVARSDFDRGAGDDKFLEFAEVHGNLYGTPREPVERALGEGRSLLLNIDVQGARQIRECAPELATLSVFLLPPSTEELERRLRNRATENESALTRRLARARAELDQRGEYDRVVVNDQIERAAAEIVELARAASACRG